MKRIDSPIIGIIEIYRQHAEEFLAVTKIEGKAEQQKQLEEVRKKVFSTITEKIKPDVSTAIETVFAFVTEPGKCEDLLNNGRGHFTRAAQNMIGTLHPNILAEMERECGEHYAESFATALSVSPVPIEGDGSMVFNQPPVKTDLAGGSQ